MFWEKGVILRHFTVVSMTTFYIVLAYCTRFLHNSCTCINYFCLNKKCKTITFWDFYYWNVTTDTYTEFLLDYNFFSLIYTK